MKKLIVVVFLLLFSQLSFAEVMQARVSEIESTWMNVDEKEAQTERKNIFLQLVDDVTGVAVEFPGYAEPLILKSAILLTLAEDAANYSSLGLVKQAKKLLQKAVGINPAASEGSALVTLGVLYYKVPAWPIAFGDNAKAEEYLLQALKVNPQGVDTNYYYAEFLIEQGKADEARPFLNKAIAIKIDPKHPAFIMKMKEQKKAYDALASIS
mgnify:CR=1 FL=1